MQETRFSQKLSSLELWSVLTTYMQLQHCWASQAIPTYWWCQPFRPHWYMIQQEGRGQLSICTQVTCAVANVTTRPPIGLTCQFTSLRSAVSCKLDMQRTATVIDHRSFAVSGPAPEIWNSLQADPRLSTLSMATFAWLLKAGLFTSTEWQMHLIFLKAALFINYIVIVSI